MWHNPLLLQFRVHPKFKTFSIFWRLATKQPSAPSTLKRKRKLGMFYMYWITSANTFGASFIGIERRIKSQIGILYLHTSESHEHIQSLSWTLVSMVTVLIHHHLTVWQFLESWKVVSQIWRPKWLQFSKTNKKINCRKF